MANHDLAMDSESALSRALAGAQIDRGKRASYQVYEVMRGAITSLRLEPNQPVSEQEVASVLSLSRTPVREAFIRLSEEGLLTSYPQLATVISPIRMEAILEAQFLREAVEGAVAAQAAEKITKAGAVTLNNIFEAHLKAWEIEDWPEFYRLDGQTHHFVGEIAGLTGVLKHLEPARAQLDRMRYVILPERETALRVIDQHKVFIDAICASQANKAREAMASHTRDILLRLPDLLIHRPELFENRPTSRGSGRR